MNHPSDHTIRARITLAEARQMPALPADIEQPFTFETESSNNSLDAYFTHMTEATLRNFAADAAAGVQFLDSHNSRNLGYGRTFGGRFEVMTDRAPSYDTGGLALAATLPAAYMRAVLETYTVPGIRFGGGLTYASTDDFIRAVRAGIARDISVGFYGGQWICDICGNDYRSWRDCPHMAGFEYPLGEQGERIVVATVAIDGARLAEHSAVFDGATPAAMITKAGELARAGALSPEKARLFEARHHVRLPDSRQVFVPAPALPASEERMEMAELVERLRQAGAPAEADADAGLRWLAESHSAAQARIAELEPLAALGRRYREDVLAETLAEGVRAMGAQFPTDTYRAMLADAGMDELQRVRQSFAELARQRLPAGRQTGDAHQPPPDAGSKPPAAVVPDRAYS